MASETASLLDLIGRARSGDGDALGRLLNMYRPALCAAAGRQLGGRLASRVDASDVVQETCLQAHQYFGHFAGSDEPALVGWLRRLLDQNVARVVRNHALLQKRDVRRERSLDDSHAGGPTLRDGLHAFCSTPRGKAIKKENVERLLGFLASLPVEQREAVRLRHLERWPIARIAEQLGKTSAAAAGLLKRGMDALRKHLDAEE